MNVIAFEEVCDSQCYQRLMLREIATSDLECNVSFHTQFGLIDAIYKEQYRTMSLLETSHVMNMLMYPKESQV